MRLITALLLSLAAPAAAAPPAPIAGMWQATLAAAQSGGLRGHLIVADSSVLHGEDLGSSSGNGGNSVWRWASVSKQLVATLVMQEVDAGRLALDTPIKAYVPGLELANADKVTLRQLLQHTSGLPNVEDTPVNAAGTMLVIFERGKPQPMVRAGDRAGHRAGHSAGLRAGLNAVCAGPAKAEPDMRFEYNDCDTEVAGMVLETVTGLPLARLLERRLFKPLRMTGARLLKAGDSNGRTGFFADGSADDFIDVGRFGAAGAVAGPPAALARFDQALMAGRLMSSAARAEMWKGEPKLGFAALGQWVYAVPLKGCAAPVELVERRGSIGGVEIRNVIAPALGKIVIAFADRPAEFGEPWQGKGLTYDLLSAAFCSKGTG
jgi:CubicO group peptidase (beta-lactamase class C family)